MAAEAALMAALDELLHNLAHLNLTGSVVPEAGVMAAAGAYSDVYRGRRVDTDAKVAIRRIRAFRQEDRARIIKVSTFFEETELTLNTS